MAQVAILSQFDVMVVHGIDDGQAFDPDAAHAQFITAGLEALLNADADPADLGSGLLAQIHQPVHCLAVGQEVIDDQQSVISMQVCLGHCDLVIPAIGVGMHCGFIYVRPEVGGPGFLGKDNRDMEMIGCHAGHGNAGSFNCQHPGNADIPESLMKIRADMIHKFHIDLMIQKAVHFQNIARQNSAFLQNSFLQFFHFCSPSFPAVL